MIVVGLGGKVRLLVVIEQVPQRRTGIPACGRRLESGEVVRRPRRFRCYRYGRGTGKRNLERTRFATNSVPTAETTEM